VGLNDFWFVLIAVLWTGYLVLEGFDFGVGMLLPVLGRDDTERRVLINTIGPVWDGNEVWLLAGLIPPVAGGLTLSGDGEPTRDLADVDPAVLRHTVSFTAEDAHVFTTTVRENLRVASPEAGDGDLETALRQAGLSAWFDALPDGWDTMLGSGGTGMSGGERRRLLLARALLAGAGVLLLDEPAEHLDPATADALVGDVLSRDGPAIVVVTHRLAPLAAADEVVVLEGAAVAARGTHAELVDRHPPYRDAWWAEQGLAAAGGGPQGTMG
jgi:ATP-binding cassette subfamily C protein CydC